MKYQCDFVTSEWFDHEEFYTCEFCDQVINEDEELFYIGRHTHGQNRMDVEAVAFKSCKMSKVPQNLTEKFPNLRLISIYNSNLRVLNKADLAEYKNLEYVIFDNNQIEVLPHDLFEGFENLKGISFADNNLTLIEPNILDDLNHLMCVDFANNPNYDMYYSEITGGTNATFDEIENELYEKFYERFEFAQELKYSKLILQYECHELSNELAKEKSKNLEQTLAINENISTDLRNLIKDDTFKDFKIIIDDREFPVHKFLLVARSPTLAEMLRNNPEAENLNLVDISVEIFELILKFLYTDEFPNADETNFLHLFAAAGRLKIKALKNFAAGKLLNDVKAENALEILNMSNKYEHDELRQKAFEEIKQNYPKIEFKDEWIEDVEKMAKFIDAFKIREEMLRKVDEDFKKMMK